MLDLGPAAPHHPSTETSMTTNKTLRWTGRWIAGLLFLMGSCFSAALAVAAEKGSKNLLIIYTDEHNFRTLGCYRDQLSREQALMWGEAVVETPNLDRIARQGAICTNFYATTPVCSPSGATLVSGLYPQNHDVVTNNIPLRSGTETFATVLRDAGYVTGFAGKWHVGGPPKPGWAPKVDGGFENKKYMFNRGHYKKIFEKSDGTPYVTDYKPVGDEKSFTTDYLTDRAIEFIDEHRNDRFCYMLSFPDPHGPDKVREPYDSMYEDQTYEKPRTFDKPESATPAWAPNAQQWQDMADYYGMVKCIDDNVGRVLEALEQRRLLEETIVVFTADHGDLRGEHGRQNKGSAYEASAKVPFLIYDSGRIDPGTVVERALGCVDFKPTTLSLIGVAGEQQDDGRDFSALLTEPAATHRWDDIAFLRGTGGGGRGSWLAAVTPRYKLVVSAVDEPWLFDLEQDPDELVNVFGKADYQQVSRELSKRLLEYARTYNDPRLKNDRIRNDLKTSAATEQ